MNSGDYSRIQNDYQWAEQCFHIAIDRAQSFEQRSSAAANLPPAVAALMTGVVFEWLFDAPNLSGDIHRWLPQGSSPLGERQIRPLNQGDVSRTNVCCVPPEIGAQ